MLPLDALSIFFAAMLAGLLGSMFGLGGGIIIIPALTLIFGLDIRQAAATSLLCVVATSTAGTAAYLQKGFTDLRLGLLLELPTVLGAITGGLIAFSVPRPALQMLFAALLLYTSYAMWRDMRRTLPANGSQQEEAPAKGFSLRGSYYDPALEREVTYHARHFGWGMLASTGAGIISGLLGVGGGIIKVPVMRLKMGVPLKVATATSTFMIGVTAATSVMLYFREGYVNLPVTAVCALGILLGATLGPRLAARIHSKLLQQGFLLLLLFTAAQMLLRALQGGGR